MPPDLHTQIASLSAEGELYEALAEQTVRCFACGHRCLITEGQSGICRVRFNRQGKLWVPKNYVAAYRIHSVEINTIFHVKPGAKALTFGMFGCDLHCPYCQNWTISQALRDNQAINEAPQLISAHALVDQALEAGCQVLCSAYNEPLITSEWAVEIFRTAKSKGLITAFISDGNATEEVLNYLRPWLDVFRVDLKAGTQEHYRTLGGRLDVVLRSLEMAWRLGFWVEVVTLLVPFFNDDLAEIRSMIDYLTAISSDIPWHVNGFYPNYKMQDRFATPLQILSLAASAGYAKGLKYVYVGNAPGLTPAFEHTYCPHCKTPVIERYGYDSIRSKLTLGACPECRTPIPGIW